MSSNIMNQQYIIDYYTGETYNDNQWANKVNELLVKYDVTALENLYQALPNDEITADNIFSPKSRLAGNIICLKGQTRECYKWAIQKAYLKAADMMMLGLFTEGVDIVGDIRVSNKSHYLSKDLRLKTQKFYEEVYANFAEDDAVDYLLAVNDTVNFNLASPHLYGFVESFTAHGNTELADAYRKVAVFANSQ